MADFFSQFLSFFLVSPLFAVFFGFLFWLLAVVITKGAAARFGGNLLVFLATGYTIIGLFALYLLINGDDAGDDVEYGAGPLLGVLASFVVLALAGRWLGRKIKLNRPVAKRSRAGQPGQPGGQGAPMQYGAADPRAGRFVPPGGYGGPVTGPGGYGGHPQQYGAGTPLPPGGGQPPYQQYPPYPPYPPHQPYPTPPADGQPQYPAPDGYGPPAGQWPAGTTTGQVPNLPRPVARPPGTKPPAGGEPPWLDGGDPNIDDPDSPDSR